MTTRTITRKQLIIEQYTFLVNELQETGLFKESIFPQIDDSNVGDIIYMMQLTFSDSSNYDNSIIDVLDYKNITLNIEDQKRVINIILPYLETFRKYT